MTKRMNMIDGQQKLINNLLELIKQNPELEILPLVDTECVGGDDYNSWLAVWGTAEIVSYLMTDERIYIKDHDYDDLVDNWIDDNYKNYPDISDEELEKIAEENVTNYDWREAIVVRIKPL